MDQKQQIIAKNIKNLCLYPFIGYLYAFIDVRYYLIHMHNLKLSLL